MTRKLDNLLILEFLGIATGIFMMVCTFPGCASFLHSTREGEFSKERNKLVTSQWVDFFDGKQNLDEVKKKAIQEALCAAIVGRVYRQLDISKRKVVRDIILLKQEAVIERYEPVKCTIHKIKENWYSMHVKVKVWVKENKIPSIAEQLAKCMPKVSVLIVSEKDFLYSDLLVGSLRGFLLEEYPSLVFPHDASLPSYCKTVEEAFKQIDRKTDILVAIRGIRLVSVADPLQQRSIYQCHLEGLDLYWVETQEYIASWSDLTLAAYAFADEEAQKNAIRGMSQQCCEKIGEGLLRALGKETIQVVVDILNPITFEEFIKLKNYLKETGEVMTPVIVDFDKLRLRFDWRGTTDELAQELKGEFEINSVGLRRVVLTKKNKATETGK